MKKQTKTPENNELESSSGVNRDVSSCIPLNGSCPLSKKVSSFKKFAAHTLQLSLKHENNKLFTIQSTFTFIIFIYYLCMKLTQTEHMYEREVVCVALWCDVADADDPVSTKVKLFEEFTDLLYMIFIICFFLFWKKTQKNVRTMFNVYSSPKVKHIFC